MDTNKHFISLSAELTAMKDRVRDFIADSHWQTDGEWKESVLRSVLNRYLPHNVEAVRGFVLTPLGSSNQLDVLLYNKSKPVLFRDGDLVFVTPDAVKGIIEVKSNISSRPELLGFFEKLADDAEFILNSQGVCDHRMFVGLFSYEVSLTTTASEAALESLREAARARPQRVINHVALGKSRFVRYWEHRPNSQDDVLYNSWHSYRLTDRAFGYFISNVLYSISGATVTEYQNLYFPAQGKEPGLVGSRSLGAGSHRQRRDLEPDTLQNNSARA